MQLTTHALQDDSV